MKGGGHMSPPGTPHAEPRGHLLLNAAPGVLDPDPFHSDLKPGFRMQTALVALVDDLRRGFDPRHACAS